MTKRVNSRRVGGESGAAAGEVAGEARATRGADGLTEAERIAELKVSLQLRDEAISTLVGDLKSPLFAIALNASLLDRMPRPAPGSEDRQRHAVGEIQHAVTRVSTIVARVLEVDALGDGQLTPDVHLHHTIDLMESATRVVEPLARARDVLVTTRVRDGAGRLPCDRVQMTQALVALLAWAVRRSTPGGRVELDATHTGLSVHLAARDAGTVLSDAEVEQLLAPISEGRGVAPTTRLLRARRVVEMHGGTLRAYAGSAGGMTFDAALPAHTHPR